MQTFTSIIIIIMLIFLYLIDCKFYMKIRLFNGSAHSFVIHSAAEVIRAHDICQCTHPRAKLSKSAISVKVSIYETCLIPSEIFQGFFLFQIWSKQKQSYQSSIGKIGISNFAKNNQKKKLIIEFTHKCIHIMKSM